MFFFDSGLKSIRSKQSCFADLRYILIIGIGEINYESGEIYSDGKYCKSVSR